MECIACKNTRFSRRIIRNPQNPDQIFYYNFCKKCGLGHLELNPSENLLSHYDENYDEYEKPAESFISKLLNKISDNRSSFILKSVSTLINANILDVGCGNGTFLSNFLKIYEKFNGCRC